jgi:hypothetical protein
MIPCMSKARRAALKIYLKAKRRYLKEHPVCERCKTGLMVTLHHKRGRAGTLYHDARFFATLCVRCHNFVHEHPQQARLEGWLCRLGDWNKVPR